MKTDEIMKKYDEKCDDKRNCENMMTHDEKNMMKYEIFEKCDS